MLQPRRSLLASIATIAFGTAAAAFADDAVLDTSFGGVGRVAAAFDVTAPFADRAAKVVKIANGGYYVIGSATGPAGNLTAILKLNEDGSPNTAFGGGDGKITVDACLAEVNDAALDPGGRILVLGTTTACGTGGSPDGRLIRITSSGALDASFSQDGIVNVRYTTVTLAHERGLALIVRLGDILAGGSVDGDGPGTGQVESAAFQAFSDSGVPLGTYPAAITPVATRAVAGTDMGSAGVAWVIAKDSALGDQGAGYIWKLTNAYAADSAFGALGLRALVDAAGETGCGLDRVHVPTALVEFGNTFKVFGFSSRSGEPNRSWYASVDNAAGAPNFALRCLTGTNQGFVSIKAASHSAAGGPTTIALAGLCGAFISKQCALRAVQTTPGSRRLIQLDSGFNAGNPFAIDYAAASGFAGGGDGADVLQQSNGRIVIAGLRVWNATGDTDFALARIFDNDRLMGSSFEAGE